MWLIADIKTYYDITREDRDNAILERWESFSQSEKIYLLGEMIGCEKALDFVACNIDDLDIRETFVEEILDFGRSEKF